MRYLTHDIPGIGGVIKQRPEDFIVDEIPLYEAAGDGEHLYLLIEKERRTTTDVVRRLANIFRVRQSDVGYAGMKDKHAVTRQHFSVYLPDRSNDDRGIEQVDFAGIKVIWARRHANKLRRGHLAGNRFDIRIRQVPDDAVWHARQVVDALCRLGVPNYLGRQRFGNRQDNHHIGRLLLLGQWSAAIDMLLGQPRDDDPPHVHAARQAYERGDFSAALEQWPRNMRTERCVLNGLRQGRDAHRAARMIDLNQRRFFISGMQSAIFNHLLERRIREGTFDHLVDGDIAFAYDGRDPSPTGPMWGVQMRRAAGVVDQWERESLHAFDLTEDDLAGNDVADARGSRRPLRTFLADVELGDGADDHGPYVRLMMRLNRGCFATVVLDEIMKTGDIDEAND
jgi:tRNA pseudouridine13 synthase